MFHRDDSKSKVALSDVKAKNISTLSQVTLSRQLLILKKRQHQQEEFKKLLEFETDKYDALCDSLLINLASYLQDLPETRNSYFSNKGGFLNHAFSRTHAALSACRAYFVSDDGKPAKKLSEPQKLWMYTLFSAALLKGIGKLYVDFDIELYDKRGEFIGRWLPFENSMRHQGAYFYDYDFAATQHDSFRKRTTLLLAKKIMPEAGFAWLAEDKNVLETWLALLENDSRDAGTLGFIMDKADDIAINRFFQELAAEQYNQKEGELGIYSKKETTFGSEKGDIEKQLKEGDIPKEGIEFVKWLNRALLTGKLLVNQSPLFMVPGGLLMSPDIFQLFIREHPQFKSWVAVQTGLSQMQLHTTGPNGEVMQRFMQSKTGQQHTGIVISAIGVVTPAQMKMVNLSNGAVKGVTNSQLNGMKGASAYFTPMAGSVSSQQTLSSSGQWQSPAATSVNSPLNPGQKS